MRLFGYTPFSVLFPKLHKAILTATRFLSLTDPLHPENNNMKRLTTEEALAVVTALEAAVANTRAAVSEARAATAEALRIAAPLAEKNAALEAHVTSLEASIAAYDKADADLDAALSGAAERLAEPGEPTDPVEPVETTPVETPVTDEAGTVVPQTEPAVETPAVE